MGRFGGMNAGIRRLVGDRIAGPAVTVEVVSGENLTIHRALARAPAGSVLVIAAAGNTERAVWGEILATAAVQRGLVGVVIDGVVRDLDRLGQLDLPTFARGSCPMGPHKGWRGRENVPVSCGGAVVHPGDVVVGDGDGVVVIPGSTAREVHEMASARLLQEADWLGGVRDGRSTLDVLELKED
jgi:4-hydroxy-4-methyl-2-oxoglutarate aldolase